MIIVTENSGDINVSIDSDNDIIINNEENRFYLTKDEADVLIKFLKIRIEEINNPPIEPPSPESRLACLEARTESIERALEGLNTILSSRLDSLDTAVRSLITRIN